jgi:hypothetical protein
MTGTNACGWGAHRKWFQTIASPGKSPVIDLDLGFGQDADAWHFDDKVPPPLQVGSWIARGFASHQASHVRVDRARSFVCIPRQDVKNCTSFSSWNMFFPSARQVLFGPSGFTIAGDPWIYWPPFDFPDGGSHTHTRFPTGELNMVNLRYLPKNPIFSWWMYILHYFTIEIAKD